MPKIWITHPTVIRDSSCDHAAMACMSWSRKPTPRRNLSQELAHRRHAMLLTRRIDRRAQRHGLYIIPTADFRFGSILDSAKKLGHGADERVRKPDFPPARLEPIAGLPFCREVERARRTRRV